MGTTGNSNDNICTKKAIRCTLPSCSCECFQPGKSCLRICESCKHGWVAHAIQTDAYALDKLGYRHIFNMGIQVEIVQPNIVFDIASLMLYGAHATPIRLKILLDRLFSVLQHDEVLQVLHGFGWSYEDYARGYILQTEDPTDDESPDSTDKDQAGRVLDKWTIANREEEHIIIQQFLRFGETKSIAQEIILQDTRERQDLYKLQSSRNDSEIKKFIERSNMTMQNFMRPFDARHLFGARLPFVTSPPLTGFSPPSARDLRPPVISVGSTSPVTSTPLGRLQTMQPFDFRRESSSPSPGEKRLFTESSPKCESPQNLSMTSTSGQSTPPHTPFTPQKTPELDSPVSLPNISSTTAMAMGGPSMILPIITRPMDEENRAINFSIKDESELTHSFFADRKLKHLRKSVNPIKRHWIPPGPGFGTSFIGPNGKKRVVCSACNKSFCDKGALKIHYSAVHLKEMHKCSVEGCTMMFSSRRSRNRHSANPNPKLHMPQKRPKMPDGSSVIDDGSNLIAHRPLSTPPMMVMGHGIMSHSPLNMAADGPEQRPPFYADPNIQFPQFPSAMKRLKLDLDDEDTPKDLSLPTSRRDQEPLYPDSRRDQEPLYPDSRRDQEPLYPDMSKESQDGSQSEGERQETGSTSSGPPRSSRRKNIPTRCAQPSDMFLASDDHSDDRGPSGKDMLRERLLNNGLQDGRREDLHSPMEQNNQEQSNGDKQTHGKQDDNNQTDNQELKQDNDEGSEQRKHVDNNYTKQENEYIKIGALSPQGSENDLVVDFSRNAEDENEDNLSTVSEHDSNASGMSTDESGDAEIPIDKDNPRTCVTCGKMFLNVFGLKIHYRNVHLKLLHKCSVEGCNSAFPSKRSRDRHSSNLNLHRKMLSASDDKTGPKDTDDNQNFRADIIQKLYQCPNLSVAESNGKDGLVNGHNRNTDSVNSEGEDGYTSDQSLGQTSGVEDNGELGVVQSDGMVTCHICQAKVRDNLVLKEHFELNHPKEMFHCMVKGCDKIFSTRKSRNRHSQNHNLHRSSSPNGHVIMA